MHDVLGKKLEKSRISAVLPLINGRLLDIGCGMNNLVKSYGSGIGVDVYNWGDVDIVVEDTANLPFRDHEFDTITIIAALNHIPNRGEVLKECDRVLSDQGKLIITMIPPFISGIWHMLRKPWDVDQRQRGMVQGEVFGFRKNQLVELCDRLGFRLVLRQRFMLGINSISMFEKKHMEG